MKRKLIISQLILAGLALILVLPKTFGMRQSAIIMSLPTQVGEWQGRKSEPHPKVIESLADDTIFEQARYHRPTSGKIGRFDSLAAFIVLSGQDMNNSIHRPERCHRAQGKEIIESSLLQIDVGSEKKLPVRRLLSKQPDGSMDITYYWFTGAQIVTPSHYKRTLTDMVDRLKTGANQHWAYVTLATSFGFEESDDMPISAHPEEHCDAMLVKFTKDVFRKIHRTDQLKGDWSDRAELAPPQ